LLSDSGVNNASLIVDSMRLRRNYLKFYPKVRGGNRRLYDKDIALTGPLWLDPKDSFSLPLSK
jgi:hypothetical protein